MKVLFVCSANICRSALAEVILRSELQSLGIEGVEVSSAGVDNFAGRNRDEMMRRLALESGYELGGMSRQVSRDEVNTYDLIVVMDRKHYVDIQKILNYDKWGRLHLFLEVCLGEKGNVPDPSYDTEERYRSVFRLIQDGCRQLARRIGEGAFPR